MEAVIFIGVQGAGKTSFYRQRFFDTHVRISLDMLRTRRREQILLAACLEARQSFVVDNTNPLPADRARYIHPAQQAGFHLVACFFQTPLQDAIRRNNQRESKHKVPVAAVVSTFKKLRPPTLEEGFHEIRTVQIVPDGQFVTSGANAAAIP